MKTMNEGVKTSLCDWIFNSATDEELINFAADIKSRKQRETKIVSEIAAFVGFNPITGKEKTMPQPEVAKKIEPEVKSTAPVLMAPPGEASAKIGSETRDKIRAHLGQGPDTLSGIAGLIKRPAAATQSLLKLLWERKEITFDGEKYKLRN